MHKSLDEFKNGQIRPLVSMATDATFSRLFLMGSFLYLQVMMTYIRAWMSLKFGQIRPQTTELAALKLLKNLCFHFSWLCINPIHFKFVGIEDMHNI